MKSVYYWCPYISKVATVKAVINSAESLKKYSNNFLEPVIINVAGEWNHFKKNDNKQNLKFIDLTNSKILENKNWTGFLKRRLIYLYVIFLSVIPLIKLYKTNKIDFLILHLITSVPLLINYFTKSNFQIILRISGMPNLNFFRKKLWNLTLTKVSHVTCPTQGTFKDLQIYDSFKKKLKVLYDPIISPSEITRKSNEEINNLTIKSFYISIGRFTRQKNFIFLIDCFSEVLKKINDVNLLIIGEGELQAEMLQLINKKNLNNRIQILPYKRNIFNYLKKSKGFILTSLWEDPGFVLIEASFLKVPIISSDCKNGPEEILNYGKNGILFKSNDKESFLKNFEKFHNLSDKELEKFKINSKKNIKKFTSFRHYKQLKKIILNEK